jgi:alanyl-tRNA synthetase
MLTGNQVRTKFIEFFKDKLHKHYESASLIPDDETLLLTVAGMVPFKPFFLGQKEAPHSRVTTYQKCIRTNDLDNVGRTARHHTFFEMLGNFSFGDYFKKESIVWSWEFITEVLKLDKSKLWITVYKDDQESADIWHEVVGVPRDRIVFLGEADNWWAAGPTGSCGPCSEIHVDQGEHLGCGPDCKLGCECDSDRYLEIWNLVFTEWNRMEDGSLQPLPKKNIDTGAGLERITSVVQNKKNNFETDLLFPILEEIANKCNKKYGENDKTDFSLKVITDHARAVTFLVGDGVLPSNEGRGYILRRILRRAIRHARLLGNEELFLNTIIDKVIDVMKVAYEDLVEKKEYIKKVVLIEEEKFSKTLDQGIKLVNDEILGAKSRGETKLSSELVFKLHDTFGFPYELTEEICNENEITVSYEEYKAKMEEQKERARNSREVIFEKGQDDFIETFYDKYGKTIFLGYEDSETEAIVYSVKELDDNKLQLIFDKTVFYAESGGQAADYGLISSPTFKGKIVDVQKQKEIFMHIVEVVSGEIKKGEKVTLEIDTKRRDSIRRNHTATHLLHKALRTVVGEHVHQAGSLVTDERLRFDFSHFESLTTEQISEIERLVNEQIFENLKVQINHMDIEEAKTKGAQALFGDKYGDIVRVVEVGDYSMELCGGTHVDNTGEIGLFNIVAEQGIAAGTRRIEATTGYGTYKTVIEMENELDEIADVLKTDVKGLGKKVQKLLQEFKDVQKELERANSKLATFEAGSLFDNAIEINGIKVILKSFENKEADSLREIVDKAKDKLKSCVVVLGTNNDKAVFAVGVTKDLTDKVKAGDLVKELAKVTGGNGGGRPDFAQAGGKEGKLVPEALDLAKKILEEKL